MRTTIAIAASCFLCASLSAAEYAAAAIKQQTNIPAQSLESALEKFARERSLQLVYATDEVGGLQTVGANGNLSASEALTRLLQGTGLSYRFLDDKTITVQPAAGGAQKTSAAMGAKSSATMAPDLWRRLRLAQTPGSGSGQVSEKGDPASGTEQRPARAEENAANAEISEIIVTAQKRAERLVDVPQSVSVLTGDELTRIGAFQFRDFANTVPGLSFTSDGAGWTNISMRGVTVGADISPTVAINVDDVPYGPSSSFANGSVNALDVALFDLDRIEVLRGPQGTLYGSASMGGLIKYVSKRPDTRNFGMDLQTGVSATQDGGVGYNVAAGANIPLAADRMALRVSGYQSHDGGYIDNLTLNKKNVNRSDIFGGRVDLLLMPSDALDIRLTAFLQNIDRDGKSIADYTLAGIARDDDLDQRRLHAEPFDQRFRLFSGTLTYGMPWATLTSVSSYQTMRRRSLSDVTALILPFLSTLGRSYSSVASQAEASLDKFTQELRLASSGGGALEWLVGGFYTREKLRYLATYDILDLAGQPAVNDLLHLGIPSRYADYAAFGDLTYHFTDKFDVTGGVRYSRNVQSNKQTADGPLSAARPARSSEENVVTYLANARYHFSDNVTGYLRYATGYRPGGPNILANDLVTGRPLADPTFDADELRSYELGFKAETASRAFGVDAAVYYIDWSDIQIIALRGVPPLSIRTNAPGGATVRGTEVTLTARPTSAFTVTGAFAYMDSELADAFPDQGGVKGERLPTVPRFTGNLDVDYVLPLGGRRPYVGATLRQISDRTMAFGSSAYRLPEYTTVDLRAGLTLGSVDLQMYVRNLLDERGQLSELTNGTTAQIAIQQPRTLGIIAVTHF